MYLVSLHRFDSPQFLNNRLHCAHLLYLSHCSCRSIPGLMARIRSSASRSCRTSEARSQSSSRRFLAAIRRLNLLDRSSIILQNKNYSAFILTLWAHIKTATNNKFCDSFLLSGRWVAWNIRPYLDFNDKLGKILRNIWASTWDFSTCSIVKHESSRLIVKQNKLA